MADLRLLKGKSQHPAHARKVKTPILEFRFFKWYCVICEQESMMTFPDEKEAKKYLVRHGVDHHGHD